LKKEQPNGTIVPFEIFDSNTPKMKLNDLFVPVWKHSDPQVRIKAIAKNNYDEDILSAIIKNADEEIDVVYAAIDKLQNREQCEKLFLNIYGKNGDEKRKKILQKLTDENRIHTIYWEIRNKGGKSFLEIPLEERLFEIWKSEVEQIQNTDELIAIAQKSLNHFQGSYKSSGSYSITREAIKKIPDLKKLSAWVQQQFALKQELHYSIQNGLSERLKQQDSEIFFSTIDNVELLLFIYKNGEHSLITSIEKRLFQMGKKVRVNEYDKEGNCSSCDGAGGGDARIPYTDNDWKWERCEYCNGTGRELFHLKEYFIEDLKD
jgi:hypothetical protein